MFNPEEKLDLEYIKNVVQEILNRAHTEPEKRVLIVRPNEQVPKEISFACAICGDSHNRPNMKRAHLFLRNFYVKCYNDDSCSMSFIKYCKHLGVEIDPEKRIQIYNHIDKNWTYSKKDDFIISSLDKLINLEDFFTEINKNKTYLKNISPITKGSIFHRYLAERKIFNYENLRCGYYQITSTWTEPVIIMLNRTEDKLLGMQLRNLKREKEKRIYKFIDFQECYNMVHHEEPLDEIEAINYNKLSAIFNFFNVDLDGTVYVFEGFLDSLFFPNAVALVGLDTDISMLKNENVDMRFILDNDKAGQKKSKQMIDEGNSVFLWRRLINDLSKGRSVKFRSALEDCKDINALAQFYGDSNIYHTFNLEKYFAKDMFDLIDM